MPAEKISSKNAISTKASDSQVETKPEGEMPAAGPPIDQHDDDEGRSERNRSTTR